jgi:hypothetical protein
MANKAKFVKNAIAFSQETAPKPVARSKNETFGQTKWKPVVVDFSVGARVDSDLLKELREKGLLH